MTDAISEDQAGVPGLGGLFHERVHNWADVVAIGPGLGVSTLALNNVPDVLQESAIPLVIDADALNVLAEVPTWLTGPEADRYREWWKWRGGLPTVITPHPGEMLRLRRTAVLPDRPLDTNDASRLAVAAEYAQLQKTVVVLKGHRTVVCDAPHDGVPPRAFINTTGNPGMAAGGMGDVLTGLIAALIGQGLSAFDAACLGVHCHGAAGDALAHEKGPVGFLAREVADRLPAILGQHIAP